MEYRDYYATLGVPRTASQAEIKKAFRKLARQHHPDVNKGDAAAERRFKEVSEAHEVLSDPEKRRLYDQLGADWESYQRAGATAGAAGGARAPFGGAGGFTGFSGGQGYPGGVRFEFHGDPQDLEGFSDFFRTFFAGGMGATPGSGASGGASASGRSTGAGPRGRAGGLEDLLSGFGTNIDLDGIGGRMGSNGGSAGRRSVARQPDAEAEVEISLEEAFHGTQRRVEVGGRRLDVTIPAGVDTGHRIRLSGKAGSGTDAGDLYLRIRVQPHRRFTRNGSDLRRELPITLEEALLGAEVPVETVTGRVLLRIPPGTQNGRTFRLTGQGMPHFRKEGRGDLLVAIRVVLPTSLDEEAQRLAKRFLDRVRQPDPRAE